MNYYNELDFNEVKKQISKYCSFSLSIDDINNTYPSFNKLELNRDLKRSKDALKLYANYGSMSFAGVSDLYHIIDSINKGSLAAPIDLYQLSRLMRANDSIRSYMKKIEFKADSISDLVNALGFYKSISDEIERIIDNGYNIKDDASSELKNIRRSIKHCVNEINVKTTQLMSMYSSSLMENITATRNNRTCLLIKSSDKNKIKGFIHDESASRQAVYIEPEVLLNLNNRLSILKANEKEEESRIIYEVCQLIIPHCINLKADLETITLLDTLFAKAKWAKDNDAIYADINNEHHLLFKDARHPLIDEKSVIANTYEIKQPYNHLLISGSNTGGKTVSLKVIGLFTILSMASFPIFCSEATLPLFDNVFVDVGDSQSIIESLSTFSSHLSKIKTILDDATSSSLVLIDELGSGTDPHEGECIAIAVLEYLQKNKIMSVATTHYSKVKEFAKVQDNILLASVAFDMQKMLPTYKYLEGFSGNSNAIEIASRYHLKDEVINRAYELKSETLSDTTKLIEKLEKEKIDLLNKQEALIKEKNELDEKQKLLDSKLKSIKDSEKSIIASANLKAEKLIEETKTEAKEIIEELRSKDSIKKHEEIALLHQLDKGEDIETHKSETYDIKVKDYVSIDGLQYHGEVISIKGKKACVLCNGMKMNVEVDRLTPTSRPKIKRSVNVSSKKVSTSFNSECNVIGMYVEEALSVIDKYLDDALYHKRYIVRIVHGSGTGALRKGVHNYLRNNKNVKEFRLGGEGEGGLGATVVTLKGKN